MLIYSLTKPNFRFLLIFIVLAIFLVEPIKAQQTIINEIMSSNDTTIKDIDGDFPDWIELYNSGNQTVNLTNWALTDEPNDIAKWTFPNIEIQPNSHLMVFASDKDRKDLITWETIINQGDYWKYKIWTIQPPYTWNKTIYNDENWKLGQSGIGYGDGDDLTNLPEGTTSFYTRIHFDIGNPDNIIAAVFSIDYDDGFVAYINGNEIIRKNMIGNPPNFNDNAIAEHEAVIYNNGKPDNFNIPNINEILLSGDNVLAIQAHNISSTSSDLSCIPFLTIGRKKASDNSKPVPDILEINNSFLHTNLNFLILQY